ncbi:CHAT domain-containing protein [Actinoplanes sp. NPDC051411]|uniref:CHAT domain-containing protein n=1 Tax=Actinoplanes sp. NPDC051411 TaxID=3155522 RepID=UPI00341566DC
MTSATLPAVVTDRVAELYAAGVAASSGGRPSVAIRNLRSALRLLDGRPDSEQRALLLISLAWPESEVGHLALGFRLLDEAEALLPEDRRAALRAQRALLLCRNGRKELALVEYDAAIAGLRDPGSANELTRALNNRAVLHFDAGRFGASRDDLLRCLRVATTHGLELAAAIGRVNVGCLESVAGDLPSALQAFRTAREEYQRVAPGRLAGLGVERARTLAAAGLFREADEELAAALEHYRGQRQSHLYADALQTRAEVALLSGRPGQAAEWAGQARAEFRRRGNHRRSALTALLALRAEYADAGPTAAAAERGRRLARRLHRIGLPEDARVAALVAARCLVRTSSARRPAGAAAGLLRRYGPPGRLDRLDTRLLWHLTRAEIAAAAGRPAAATRHLRAGMEGLHRYRAQFGCLDLQTGASAHGQDLARAGLRSALAAGSPSAVHRWSERARSQALLLAAVRPPDDPRAAAALEELRQTRYALRTAELTGRPTAALRAQAERLQRAVREHSWSLSAPQRTDNRRPAQLADLRAELGDAALVAYLRDGPALSALVVTGTSATVTPLGDFRAADQPLLRLRADLDTGAGRAMPPRLSEAVAAATRRDAAQLADVLLAPLRSAIGDRELIVVPTGLLMTTPWALLPDCAGRPVTVAPSATTWLAARRRARAATTTGAVLVAGPGIARGDQEVRAIAGLYRSPTVLTGAGATPAATLRAIDGAAVVHIAAHGRHQAENALFSSLELAEGPLFGYDLQRLAAPPAMVVMSSCELGLADIRPGDESFGMASALLAAGTTTVVASVSRIDDETARTVMTDFHRTLTAGDPAAHALAAATPADSAAGFVCLGCG